MALKAQGSDRPSVEEHVDQLHRLAEGLGAALVDLQEKLVRQNMSLPSEIIDEAHSMRGKLINLQAELLDQEQERRNLQALAEMGSVINSSLNLDRVLNQVIDTLIELTGAGRAFLMLTSKEGELEMVVARNWERVSLSEAEQEFSSTVVEQVVDSGEAILTSNAQADPRFDEQESVMAYNLRSILCVPLTVRGTLTGVIYADNKAKEGLFTERERDLLRSFADQAAVALENARLFESVQSSLAEVTELKQLMENVFASIASGVITADERDRVTLVNRAAEQILSLSKDEGLGRDLPSLLTELGPDLMGHVHRVKSQQEPVLGVEARLDKTGHRGDQVLRLQFTPLESGVESPGVAIVLEDLTEQRRLQAQRRLFERMVSPAVIDELDPDSIHFGGERAQITTLFADLRGYTSFSEKTPPEVLVSVLNRYLGRATEALLAEQATIDKFLGDAVMAWFNAPILQDDHAPRAARSALAIRKALDDLHSELPPEWHLSFGIGIHTGEALLGLVGAQERLEYTAVGESVNLAKRLQEEAGPGQILISQEAAEALGSDFDCRAVPPLSLAGISRTVPALELIGQRG